MNKKMIALAVAGAMTAPVVMADVTVYGRVQAEYAMFDNGDSDDIVAAANAISGAKNAKVVGDNNTLIDNAMGRIGAKFSEDLGNGLSAVGKYEFKADTIDNKTGSDAALTGRDSFVGLKGNFGTVSFGRHAGAYKGTNLDPFIATTLEARNAGGQSSGAFGHAGFISNTIKYSNKFGAVKFSALMTAGNKDNGDDGDNQIAFDYKGGPLRIVAAASTNKNADGADNDEKRTKLGAQFKTGAMKFTAQVESVSDYTPGTLGRFDNAILATVNAVEFLAALPISANTKKFNYGDVDFTMLQGDFAMGKNTISVRLGSEDYKDLDGKNDTTMVALTHKFSKKTRAWVGVFNADFEDITTSVTSLGLRHDF